MKKIIFLLSILSFSVILKAQEERKIIRQGNKSYNEKKYTEAEELYRKALEKKPQSLEANYNIGNVLYKQNKYLDAASKYSSLTNNNDLNKQEKAYIYHNMGNSYLKANKLDESIKSYKEALKLNPTDKETKFNLAYAQRRLIQQQQQQQQQNKDKKDQNKKDDKQQNQQNNKDQQNKDQQDKKEDQKNQEQQNKNISQEDANRILEAMQNDEKELQKKLKMEKVQKEKGRTLKNW